MPEQRLRALVVASHPVPYAIPVFRALAQHPQLDFQVVYCSMRGAEAEHDPEFGATVQWDVPLLEGYEWSRVENKGPGDESFFGLRNPGLWKFIREGKFDVVSAHISYVRATFWIAYGAARSSGAAFLFGCDQGSLAARDGRAWKASFKRIVWPRLFRLADQVCVSSSSARDLIRSLRIPEERISLTPLVVDNAWWMARAGEVHRRAVRESWGASEEDVVVLFCAKLQPWKRPLDLLRALVRAGVPKSILIFAGDGPMRQELEAEAAAAGVAARVRFLGFVNQSRLPAVYASADLMVLPSEYEPFAVVVNEAMCCGCPVAASDRVGAARDLVAPVRREFVYPAGDVDALTALLKDALADRAELALLRRAAAAHMNSWSPEQNVAATYETFRTAAERRKPQPLGGAVSDTAAVHTSPKASQKIRE
jgi:glycosyltransferase involved in cell wall biosynthesis